MTNIDVYVSDIFKKMLYDGNNLIKVDHLGKYYFEINKVNIILQVFGKSSKDSVTNKPVSFRKSKINLGFEWNVTLSDESGYRFYITINERQYVVPELSRVEEAQAIDRLEELLQENEISTLTSILLESDVNEINDVKLDD